MGIFDAITSMGSSGLVALDISTTRITLLSISGKPDKYRIDAYAVEPLPTAAFDDRQIVDPEIIGATIKQAMKRASCHARKAIVAVSASSVISKVINLPADLSEAEIEEEIRYESDAHIPYPIDEVRLDFQVLGPAEWNPEVQSILLAACRRETVDLYISAVEIAGLETAVVDVEAYALQNACSLLLNQFASASDTKQTVAVVKLGDHTIINILHDGETVYTREQPFGMGQLMQQFQHHAGKESAQETVAHHRDHGFDDEFLAQALPGFARQAAAEIDRSLQLYFSSSSHGGQITQILLAGGGALLPDLAERVGTELDIPAAVANPLAGMTTASAARRNGVEKNAASLMVATGLALRAFD